MTDDDAPYDRVAGGYHRWWAPVLAPTAHRLLDSVEPLLGTGRERVLDLGTGTGTLARAAVRRWLAITVDAVDVSSGMLRLAAETADGELSSTDRDRLRFRRATAESLPFDDATFDGVVSSFVIQLVANRARVLREVRRVLRPGGWLASVTWLRGGTPYRPDAVFDELLDELGLEAREPGGGSDDIPSPASLAAQLRRAGYRDVRTSEALLEHAFDAPSYLAFLAEFDEEDLFASLSARRREDLERRLLERLRGLAPDDLVLRLPVVTAIANRPG